MRSCSSGRYGVGSIEEERDSGVNEAVEGAMARLDGYDGWLIMPADLPLISPNDIKTVFTLHRMGSSIIVSPSEDYSGTNLLLMTRRGRIELHYDDDSFNKHVRDATAAGTGPLSTTPRTWPSISTTRGTSTGTSSSAGGTAR